MEETDFYNVLAMAMVMAMAMAMGDSIRFLRMLQTRLDEEPEQMVCLPRVVPVTVTFDFQTPDEFEDKAKQAVECWLSELGGAGFHVRMHQRGFKGRLSSLGRLRRWHIGYAQLCT
jgi:hypothetical protein